MIDGKRESKGFNVALWVLQILSAALFITAGISKLTGSEPMVQVFDTIGLGQWFRYFTGVLEVIGGVGLLTPRMSALGAILLTGVMAGAVIIHLALIGGSPAMALVLLAVMGIVAWGRFGQIRKIAAFCSAS